MRVSEGDLAMPIAIITGASSGIGRATALKLAALNYILILVGRTSSTLEKLDLNTLPPPPAREAAPHNARAHATAPAAVDTPMLRKHVGSSLPDSQILSANDVAQAIIDGLTGSLRHTSGDTIYLHRQT